MMKKTVYHCSNDWHQVYWQLSSATSRKL